LIERIELAWIASLVVSLKRGLRGLQHVRDVYRALRTLKDHITWGIDREKGHSSISTSLVPLFP
jgi:hypothetical protein